MNAKRATALGGVGLLVVAVAFAAVLIPLIRHARATPSMPSVTAYADGRAVTVAPLVYCPIDSVDPKNCRAGAQSTLAVPRGKPLQLSVPNAISNGLWVVIATYRLRDGGPDVLAQEVHCQPGTTNAFTIQGVSHLLLDTVEIHTPSGIKADPGGNEYYTRGIWSIQNT